MNLVTRDGVVHSMTAPDREDWSRIFEWIDLFEKRTGLKVSYFIRLPNEPEEKPQ